MKQYWYNGPLSAGRVALVGGPYPTRDAAIAAKHEDAVFADEHWPNDWPWFMRWVAIELPRGDYITARMASDTGHGPIACVAFTGHEARSET